ncbi:hypothetical protein JHK64_01880 [Streptococcus sp. CSL7508-lung]|uniref:Transglutaminase-like domain-containing protein n=2 Tax=Streptococcus zalophi TaxID=640031 RepID=A0A934UD37_9STRE|nr:hypothetical protein [Streptococcus zalophi]
MRRKMFTFIITCLAILGISGCQQGSNVNQGNQKATTELIAKYQKDSQYEIIPEIKTIKATDAIELDIMKKTEWTLAPFADFEEHQVTKSYSTNIPVGIYTDYGLKINYIDGSGRASFERDDYAGKLKIFADNEVIMSNRADESKKITATGNNDWGRLNILYLVTYNDLETGKLLKKPTVQIYKIDHSEDELQAPYINYQIDDDGLLKLTWNEVENASEYYIIRNYVSGHRDDKGGLNVRSHPIIIGTTTKTEWDSSQIEQSFSRSSQNEAFINYDIGLEDYLLDESSAAETELKRSDTEKINAYNDATFITVVAVNKQNQSAFSNMISNRDINDKLPVKIAYYTSRFLYPLNKPFEKITDLPTTTPITMADGSTKMFPIEIIPEETSVSKFDTFLVYYKIKGTKFSDSLKVKSYDEKEVAKDIKTFNKKAEKQNQKTGISSNTFDYSQFDESNIKSKLASGYVEVEDKIFSTTALGEYLAAHMISGNDYIDISQFTEAVDTSFINDVISEIEYQNPTIPHIRNVQLSADNSKILVSYYDLDKETRNKKTKEIRDVLDKAVSEIITEGMTEIEKARAINQYIISNSEYDYEAFKQGKGSWLLDSDFADAYHAYGISVEHLGVCISYAQTFNYMAKKAGLEVITVTGYVNGDQNAGHAWNAVKIDGEWRYFDITWNDHDDPSRQEEYFNLSHDDEILTSSHTQDEKRYIVPNFISNYR